MDHIRREKGTATVWLQGPITGWNSTTTRGPQVWSFSSRKKRAQDGPLVTLALGFANQEAHLGLSHLIEITKKPAAGLNDWGLDCDRRVVWGGVGLIATNTQILADWVPTHSSAQVEILTSGLAYRQNQHSGPVWLGKSAGCRFVRPRTRHSAYGGKLIHSSTYFWVSLLVLSYLTMKLDWSTWEAA